MIVIKANKIGTTPQENSMELRQRYYAALDEQNKCLRFDTFGCLTTDGSSPKHNNRVIEFYEKTRRLNAFSTRMVRTEVGKALRKDYESHKIHHGFNEYRYMTIRKDEISNTISTVIKDFIICEVYKGHG